MKKPILIIFIVHLFTPGLLWAHGPGHSAGTTMNAKSPAPNSAIYLGVQEQYSHYGTLQKDGHEIFDPGGQTLDESNTQILVGTQILPWIAFETAIPILYKEYRRPGSNGFFVEEGEERGLGDMTATMLLTPVNISRENLAFQWKFFTGVKFPTGDSTRLLEEWSHSHGGGEEEGHHEEGEEEHHEAEHAHMEVPNGVHGHNLALGTGSWDAFVGTHIYTELSRIFFTGHFQYFFRTQGDFGYQQGNTLSWSFKPGVYAIRNDAISLALGAQFSGMDQDFDKLAGTVLTDTAMTTLNIGPDASLSIGRWLVVNAGAGFPVYQQNTDVHIVQDYQAYGSLTFIFGL